MPNGVRDMGFFIAIKLFQKNGMTNEKPDKPKAGDMFLDPVNKMWRVYNGKTWVDVNLRKHKCNLDEE